MMTHLARLIPAKSKALEVNDASCVVGSLFGRCMTTHQWLSSLARVGNHVGWTSLAHIEVKVENMNTVGYLFDPGRTKS